MTEHQMTTALAAWIKSHYPWLPFRFDLIADMPLPMKYARRNGQLHGADFTRGHPDLIVYIPGGKPLFMELKATESVPDSEHTRIQRAYHQTLRDLGYDADFYCGLPAAQKKIKKCVKPYKKELR